MRHLLEQPDAASQSAQCGSVDVAPLQPQRGDNMTAQDNALGGCAIQKPEALKGRNNDRTQTCLALSGLLGMYGAPTQGVALGWLIAAPLGRNRNCATFKLAFRAGTVTVLALTWMLGVGLAALAQDDDDDPPAEVVLGRGQVQNFEMPENQFDQWVFQNFPTAVAARTKLDQMLSLQMDDVDRACQLTEAQKKKLQLAGRGDMMQFFEQVEVVRKKFLLVRKDQQKFNEIWQDISPLQMKFQAGLFSEDSFYHKTLRNMLKGEQLSKYSQIDGERRKFQYRAKVELVVAMLENALPLRDEQRQKVITLIVEETKPPRSFGQQQDYYIVMWNISKIPEKTIKPLFNDAEWKVLNQQFAQVRGLEQWLKQSGALAKEEEGE